MTPSSVAYYHSQLSRDSFGVVSVDDFLRPERARQLRRALAEESSYDTIYALLHERNAAGVPTKGVHVEADEWNVAPADRRLFWLDMIARIRFPISSAGAALLECIDLLQERAFASFLEAISGEPLSRVGVEAHRMRNGQFVGFHSDDRAGRRYGFIIYLSRHWTASDGGALVFTKGDGSIRTHVPKFNSLLVFDVARHHGHLVEAVAGSRPRLSLNGWCLGI